MINFWKHKRPKPSLRKLCFILKYWNFNNFDGTIDKYEDKICQHINYIIEAPCAEARPVASSSNF